MSKTILISAGEISGDLYGANLISEIKKIKPDIRFIGMGHQRMKQAGVKICTDLSSVSTIGLIEPLIFIPKIMKSFQKMKMIMEKEKPDLIIPIDYQGYNMTLIKLANKLNIPVVYYISPQEWQWGTEKKGKKIVEYTKKIIAIFKEEADFYNRLGGVAKYFGHPIVDIAKSNISKTEFFKKYNLDEDKKIISIFPGSRPQELKYTFPILLQAAKGLQQEKNNLQFVISVASQNYESKIIKTTASYDLKNVIFYYDNQYDLIKHTTLSLLTSGTITLEHACLGCPFIANYRFSKISYFLIKKLLAKKFKNIKYISLPNILAKQEIAPEFLQENCNSKNIVKKALILLNNQEQYFNVKNNLLNIKKNLGTEGVTRKIAQEIVGLFAK